MKVSGEPYQARQYLSVASALKTLPNEKGSTKQLAERDRAWALHHLAVALALALALALQHTRQHDTKFVSNRMYRLSRSPPIKYQRHSRFEMPDKSTTMIVCTTPAQFRMRHLTLTRFFAAFLVAILPLVAAPSRAQNIVVGVNAVNPMRASVDDQNVLRGQLKAAHVSVIRCGISNDAKGLDFAKRAAQSGIRIQLIVSPAYSPDAPSRAYQPTVFPFMWGGHPLSWADPALSKAAFQKLFDALDQNDLVLAGIELGNEINWAAFNPEFSLPGEGKILSRDDLVHDPEGQQIAKGFDQYLNILKVLKEVRDQSNKNRAVPIISAGLVSAKDGEKPYNNKKEDMVGLAATLGYLREHGLDSLVDGYGIHSYPSSSQPGNEHAAEQRAARLRTVDLAQCRAAGSPDGKPCWITEWGFPNADRSCPANEGPRLLLITELRNDFEAERRVLAGIDYFSWNSDPWAKEPDADSVFRCDALTESGRRAIAPMR